MSGVKRRTWQQTAVRDALDAAPGFVSAQQLHASLREGGSSIGLATVYRALSNLVEAEEADTIVSPTGENLYFLCETDTHHHHLVCRSCGATEEIAAQVIEEWSKRVAQEHGFVETSHEIDIFGLCRNCQ